jgi:hypothetical protein
MLDDMSGWHKTSKEQWHGDNDYHLMIAAKTERAAEVVG